MKPKIPLTNRAFKYVPSAKTDVRKTWARIRREMAEEAERKAEEEKNVVQLKRATK